MAGEERHGATAGVGGAGCQRAHGGAGVVARQGQRVFAVKMSLLSSGNAAGLVFPAVLELDAQQVVVRDGGEAVGLRLCQQEQRVPQLHEEPPFPDTKEF
ncbi:hypothetical protein SEVIR_8G231125v4 [Setaria viridis]